ncbi:MAG: hypothetical protein Q8S73_24085, partial [Deltaproteobacteria bacterium]|nr:hypothetical protein [Deltaproteobacteria bacterium]
MAKNKGKRNRSQRNSTTSTTLVGPGSTTGGAATEAAESEHDERESIVPEGRASSMSIEPTPSSDNVIPFPRASLAAEGRDTKATLIAGTGAFATPKAAPAEADAAVAKADAPAVEAAKPAEDSALRPVAGERERTTIPPEDATGERAKVPPPDGPVVAADKPVSKAADKAAKASEDETRKTLRGEVVGKKDEARRGHKESLSTHLSDEAKAFFSEAAAGAAYKQTHDTFEDLAPASEEHALEAARSKRAMTITGALLVGVIAVVAGFGIYSRTSVPETGLETRPTAVEPVAPVAANPTPPPPAEPAPPPVPP